MPVCREVMEGVVFLLIASFLIEHCHQYIPSHRLYLYLSRLLS